MEAYARVQRGRTGQDQLSAGNRMPLLDRLVVTGIDDILTGNDTGRRALVETIAEAGSHVGFGIATGRRLERALQTIDDLGIPMPDVLITATGTQLHYGERLIRDRSWERQIHHR